MIATALLKFQKWVVAIAIVANVSGALVLFALVGIMNADVVSRGFFNAPFRGVVEVVVFSLVLIVFLQLPDVVRTNRLTRSDGFLVFLRFRKPVAAHFLGRLIDAISCVFMGMIVWTVWPEFVESFESCHFFVAPELGPARTGEFMTDLKAAMGRCDYFGTPGILTAPWWPARLAIVFGSTFATIIFFLKAVLGDSMNSSVTLKGAQK